MMDVFGCGEASLIVGVISVVDNSGVVGINVGVRGNWSECRL